MTVRFFAYVLLAVAAAAGCADSAASTIPANAGRDASIDPDGSLDIGDGGTDGSIQPDGGGDAGPDAGDGGSDAGPRCGTCPNCPDPDLLCDEMTPCPTGQVCETTGCDDSMRCFVIGGGACDDNSDCADSNYECVQVDQTLKRCLRTTPGCDTSNDCITGFACEDNECVDRRVPCVALEDCPHGYACRRIDRDQRFCRRITRPCDDDIDCLTLGVLCGDVEGDGPKECMPSLTPNEPGTASCDNSQCGDNAVCETTLEGTRATCGQFGLCGSAADCDTGFECRDLWGDRKSECVRPGGSCDCAEREVCASPRSGGPPVCVGGAAM